MKAFFNDCYERFLHEDVSYDRQPSSLRRSNMKRLVPIGIAVLLAVSVSIIFIFNAQASPKGCNCVAFRLDDVQDYYLHDVQVGVMNEFAKRDLVLTVGVIGNYFGDDQKIVSYVKEGAAAGRLEIANHGWNHESFIAFSEEEQSSLMNQTNTKLSDLLGFRPVGFLAPYNTVNSDTFNAAKENNILYISANMTMDRPPYRERDGLYHYPETAMTGNLNDDDTQWLGFDHETTMKEIRQSVRDYGFAVVNLHPQEFSARNGLQLSDKIDEKQLAELDMLFSTLKEEKYGIVTMAELPQHVAN